MKRKLGLIFLVALALAPLIVHSQTPVPTPPTTKPADDDSVVRVTTNLIQIDVVVTDSKGNLVKDLKQEDFEIRVNGKVQPITAFSSINLEPQPPARSALAGNKTTLNQTTESTPPAPTAVLRPNQVKRTVALIIDDVSIDCQNIPYVQKALKKFADEQMQEGDLVAIVRVGSSIGALQQFTSDRQQINAAIERVRFNPGVGRCLNFGEQRHYLEEIMPELAETDRTIKGDEGVRMLLEQRLANPGLTATNVVIKAMRDLPGRKAVMLFSEGFALEQVAIRESVKRLVDTANRSGVVIYTMDARGLVSKDMSAAEILSGPIAGAPAAQQPNSSLISIAVPRKMNAFHSSQEGMMYLAEQAGGFAVYNTNDIAGGIRKVLDDQQSYYLIGYQPDASLFDEDADRFNQLKIKVKGSGLKVRYRSGFFGFKDEAVQRVASSPEQKILRALTSPFASDAISLRLTPLFANDPKAGSFMRTLVHVPVGGLSFVDKPGDMKEAVISIAAYTFGDNGKVVDSVGETHTITLSGKLYERAINSGLVYSLDLPVKKAGPYQLRVAVRDDKSDKVGTASQFIVVPDLKQERLMLSGIALSSFNPNEQPGGDEDKLPAADAPGNNVLTQAALRRFRAGDVLQYAYSIFNATTNAGASPQLTTQIKLYRDGKELFAGKQNPYDVGGQADLKRLLGEGSLQLGGLTPGQYILQTIVIDANAKGKYRKTTGWIDFEIVK
jgi:VWFA-related protein